MGYSNSAKEGGGGGEVRTQKRTETNSRMCKKTTSFQEKCWEMTNKKNMYIQYAELHINLCMHAVPNIFSYTYVRYSIILCTFMYHTYLPHTHTVLTHTQKIEY